MKQHFFIFGYYGWKNTGDDGMIYALLQRLHVLYPTFTFSILSKMPIVIPPETMNLVKFIRPEPQVVFREIMHSSIFIMGGGTQIYDYGKRKARLKVMSEMLIMLLWAKIFCKRIYFLSIGIEPFSTNWGNYLLKWICQLADFISVRDKSSYQILDAIGLRSRIKHSFDLTALLPSIADGKHLPRDTGMKILGISILPFFEIYHGDKERDRLFVQKIAEGLNQWLKRDPQSRIYLFVFKGESKADDVLISDMLRKQLQSPERVKLIPYNPDPLDTLHKVSQCHAFIGMRYHSCMFAYLTNTPLLIINYFQKCKALAEDTGLSEHAIISPEEILNGKFGKYIKYLQLNPGKFTAKLPIAIAKQRAKEFLSKDEIGEQL